MQEPMNEGEYELAHLSLAELTKAAQAEFRELLAQLPDFEASATEQKVEISVELINKIGDFTTKLQRAYDMHAASNQVGAEENLTILIRLGDQLWTQLFNLSKNDAELLEKTAMIHRMKS